jgi:surface antigen Omp85-like protein
LRITAASRLTRGLLALGVLGAVRLARPALAPSQSYRDAWRPQTVPLFGASYSPDVGLLLGVGIVHTRYGFRALPPSTRLAARAAYATGARALRADVAAEFRRPLSPSILNVELRASGLEIIRFYGVGNETDGSAPDSFYRVRQTQLLVAPTVSVPLTPRLRLAVGPLLKYAHTRADSGTLFAGTGPYYGTDHFGEIGARAVVEFDTRDMPAAAARGVHLRLAGRWHPAAWDVADAFSGASAEAASYFSAGDPPEATVALRAGGSTVGGTAPFHEIVYIGGETTVRGYAEQRFAGSSGAYANAELRLRAGRLPIGDVGLFGLADAGRVWSAGGTSDRWHGAAGGGLWFAWRHSRANTVTLAAARSPERTAIYLRAGFMF